MHSVVQCPCPPPGPSLNGSASSKRASEPSWRNSGIAISTNSWSWHVRNFRPRLAARRTKRMWCSTPLTIFLGGHVWVVFLAWRVVTSSGPCCFISARGLPLLLEREGRSKRGGNAVLDEAALGGAEAGRRLEQVLGREPTPEFAAEVAEECGRLLASLDQPDLRTVAQLKMEGYTNGEVADRLRRTIRSVKRKLCAFEVSGARASRRPDLCGAGGPRSCCDCTGSTPGNPRRSYRDEGNTC